MGGPKRARVRRGSAALRGRRLLLLVNVEPVVQGVQADPERLGGSAFVAVEVGQRPSDELALDVADRAPDLQAFEPCLLAERALETLRQLELIAGAVGQNVRAVNHVTQLAHVAWPMVGLKALERLL